MANALRLPRRGCFRPRRRRALETLVGADLNSKAQGRARLPADLTTQGCGNRRDFQPGRPHIGQVAAGATYAPFVLNRYSSAAEGAGPGRSSTIYWLISTWNPYEVTVTRSTLHVEAR
jgi:hypothetical protein